MPCCFIYWHMIRGQEIKNAAKRNMQQSLSNPEVVNFLWGSSEKIILLRMLTGTWGIFIFEVNFIVRVLYIFGVLLIFWVAFIFGVVFISGVVLIFGVVFIFRSCFHFWDCRLCWCHLHLWCGSHFWDFLNFWRRLHFYGDLTESYYTKKCSKILPEIYCCPQM